MRKQILSILLVLAMVLAMTACGAKTEQTSADVEPQSTPAEQTINENRVAPSTFTAAESFSGGSGTEEDPYQIATAEELARLAYVTSHEYYEQFFTEAMAYQRAFYVLTADIALNDTADYDTWSQTAPEYQWTPIGAWSVNGFKGHFDGQGHTISGMYLYGRSSAYAEGDCRMGLFETIFEGSTVENVNLEKAYIVTQNTEYIGLLAGTVWSTGDAVCVSGVHTSGTIEVTEDTTRSVSAGGISGKAYGYCTVSDCTFTGTIQNACYAGGITGNATCSAIRNCTAEGEILAADGSYCGGIAGHLDPWEGTSTVTDCINRLTVTQDSGDETIAGGIVGSATLTSWSTIEEGEWISSDGNVEITNCVNEADIGGESIGSGGGILGSVSNFSGTGTASVLIADCTNQGTVSGTEHAGGILADCDTGNRGSAVIQDCVNAGSVTSQSYAGGILGLFNPGRTECQIAGCKNSGIVEAGTTAGGILGSYMVFSLNVDQAEMQPLRVQRCQNDGEVLTTDGISGAGGIVGSIFLPGESITYLTIENCINTHEIHTRESGRVGGILGSAGFLFLSSEAATDTPLYVIRNCANTADLCIEDATSAVGDGSEYDADEAATVSAAVEQDTDSELTANNATFLILGGNSIGGIVGYHKLGLVEDCVFSGNIVYGDNVTALSDKEGLHRAASDSDSVGDNALISGGGICGVYYYLNTDRCTAENTGIRSCVYSETVSIPYAAFFDTEDSISGVQAVSEQAASARAAEIASGLN